MRRGDDEFRVERLHDCTGLVGDLIESREELVEVVDGGGPAD